MTTASEVGESQIQADVRRALSTCDDVTMWRNHVGFDPSTNTRYGLCVGSADLVGILAPSGRLLALEVKAPRGRTSEAQDVWMAHVRTMGGFACVVRSPMDALLAIARAREGASR